jgi:hypothetical protein
MNKSLAILLSGAFMLSTRAAIPPAENLLPSDTLFFLTVPGCAGLRAAARQLPAWLFWNDPAMDPFRKKFEARFQESFLAPLEQSLGVKLADYADLPQGQFTLAVTQNGWTGGDGTQQPDVLLLLDAGSKSDLLKTNLAALLKKWTEGGKPIHTADIRGIPFSVLPLSSGDLPAALSGLLPGLQAPQGPGGKPKTEKPGELVVGQYESLLIAGNSVDAVEPVVAHLTGSEMPALRDNARFAADKLAQLRNAPLCYGWLNAKNLFDSLARMSSPAPDAPSLRGLVATPLGKIIAASGLTGVTSACFAWRETPDGSQANIYIAAPQSDRNGLTKIFAPARKGASPPPFVPASAVNFWRWRLDGQGGWDALNKMLADISPLLLSALNATIDTASANAQKTSPGLDIRNDLIANLGDDFISYQNPPAGKTLTDINNPPALFLIGVDREDAAALAIYDVAQLAYAGRQKAVDPRVFDGRKIYTVPLPGQQAASGAAAAPRSLYLAGASGYVALTKDSAMLEAYLRSASTPPKPLSRMPGLLDAAQHVGGAGGGLFGYENQRDTMRAFFAAKKKANTNGDPAGSVVMSVLPKEVRGWMDFSLLPDFDSVSKYFSFSVYGGSTTSDGLTFEMFSPRPPELK